jgi:S1-C subfamily serine protease
MQDFFKIYLIFLSLLGWNIPTSQINQPISIIDPISSSSPTFKNENTPTVITKAQSPLPYLKIIAPEFKLIPLKENRVPKINPLPPEPKIIAEAPNNNPEAPTGDPGGSIINIYCTTRVGNTITAVTGSGVIISPQGIVLTNSHVAQYVLIADYLKDKNRSCEARTGSVARSAYAVHVLYMSSNWVKNNSTNLKDINPQGTGEYDYALLVLENGVKKLPNTLPYLDLETKNLAGGDQITAYAYPAGHLDAQTVSTNLRRISDSTNITKTYSFGYTNSDLVLAQTDTIAQKGSSGGAVVDSAGKLGGIITTSIPGQNGHTSLAALTTSYIIADISAHSNWTISSLLSGQPQDKWEAFENQIGFPLAKILLSN